MTGHKKTGENKEELDRQVAAFEEPVLPLKENFQMVQDYQVGEQNSPKIYAIVPLSLLYHQLIPSPEKVTMAFWRSSLYKTV